MSTCDLEITLDHGERAYALGERVSGTLTVEVNKACHCNALSVERLWRTHGRGNRAEGDLAEAVLFSGQLRPGERQRFPFTLELPARGPITYHGHYLNVGWYLRARADVPWVLDPKTATEILVGPAATAADGDGGASPGGEDDPAVSDIAERVSRLAPLVIGGLVLVAGLIFLFFAQQEGGALVPTAAGLIFTVAGLGTVLHSLRSSFAERKLGAVEASLSPRTVRPGGEAQLSVGFRPQARVTVNTIRARLCAREVVVRGSGKNRTTYRRVVHDETQTLAERRTLYVGHDLRLAERLTLPPAAPPSFKAPDNRLEWTVTLHIDVAAWPDWTRTLPLEVVA